MQIQLPVGSLILFLSLPSSRTYLNPRLSLGQNFSCSSAGLRDAARFSVAYIAFAEANRPTDRSCVIGCAKHGPTHTHTHTHGLLGKQLLPKTHTRTRTSGCIERFT